MHYLRRGILFALFTALSGSFQQAGAQPVSDSLLQHRLDSLKQQSVIDTTLIKTYFDLAHYYLRQDSAKTAYYANRALQVADSIDSQIGRGIGKMTLGLHYIIQGNYRKGLRYSLEAESIYKELHRADYLAMLYSYIGIAYSRMGNNNQALHYYLQSDSLMAQTGTPMQQAQIKANIGIIYSSQGHHRSTISYFREALGTIKKYGNPAHVALAYHNIGIAYQKLGKPDSALVYIEKGLELRRKANDKFGLATSLYSMGTVYTDLKQYEFGLDYHLKAIELRKKLGDQGNLTTSYLDAGKVYRKLGQHQKAKEFARKSFDIAERIGDLKHQAGATKLLSNLKEDEGDYRVALDYLQTHLRLQDSLAVQNRAEAFEEMRAKYEAEELEQQIKMLQQEQTLREAKLARAEVLRNSLIGGTGALMVILALLFLRYRSGKKNEALLQAKNEQLEEANEKIRQNQQVIRQQSERLRQTNNELRQQNKKLEELNEEKNEYLRIGAHDLKTPLGSISGLAELIKDTDCTIEEARQNAEYIYISAFRMLDLINMLLDVNAIESGKKLAENRPVDLAPELDQVIDRNQYRAEWKDIDMKMEMNTNQLPAIADPAAFQEVIENLISNAIKYSPSGSSVWVRGECREHVLHFEIEDEGAGISEEDQQQLFQKFKRLSTEPTGGENSTGLGLYIVKKMVNAMDGKVWCESQPGEGSIFIVELPRDTESETALKKERES